MSTPAAVAAKAESVDRDGVPDGFQPPSFYRPEVLQGGYTRLTVSLPSDGLEVVHKALVAAMGAPLKLLYVQLTDRDAGTQLPKPRQLVAIELSAERVADVLTRFRALVYEDGRHQLWIRGPMGEQIVLEEIGMLYAYPDDLLFRDVLEAHGVQEGSGETLAERDYIRVRFDAENDAQEGELIEELHLVEWAG